MITDFISLSSNMMLLFIYHKTFISQVSGKLVKIWEIFPVFHMVSNALCLKFVVMPYNNIPVDMNSVMTNFPLWTLPIFTGNKKLILWQNYLNFKSENIVFKENAQSNLCHFWQIMEKSTEQFGLQHKSIIKG